MKFKQLQINRTVQLHTRYIDVTSELVSVTVYKGRRQQNGTRRHYQEAKFLFSRMKRMVQDLPVIWCLNRDTQRQFLENICSEDDLRSRIFGTFVVKFLVCPPLLGFSSPPKMVQSPIFNGFLP